METGASQTIERQGPSLWEEERVYDPTELQRLYLDDVWRYVSSRLDRREDAEDVTMDVMLSAFHRLQGGAAIAEPKVWLLTIAKNKVADFLRRKYRRPEAPLIEADTADAKDHLRRLAVQAVLGQMSEEHGQALVLKYVNGLSTDEVAAVMKRSPEAANSLLQRARQSFRELAAATFELTEREEEEL